VVESELPAGTVAYLLHVGDYAAIGQSHDRLVAWCADQGLHRAGPLWEVYGHMREGVEPTVELYHLLSDEAA
jgi:effector-binding domain-containing protein